MDAIEWEQGGWPFQWLSVASVVDNWPYDAIITHSMRITGIFLIVMKIPNIVELNPQTID